VCHACGHWLQLAAGSGRSRAYWKHLPRDPDSAGRDSGEQAAAEA
jgi:hypothetical protein